jgi:alpha-L-rhamnosidase
MSKHRLILVVSIYAIVLDWGGAASLSAEIPGQLSPQWSAKWIGYPGDDSNKAPEAAPQFRKEFSFDGTHGKISNATLWITGLGCYECKINGQHVTADVLDPGWTDYRKTVLFNRFDVTTLLKTGPNAIGVTLGNGPYDVLRIKGRYTKFTGSIGTLKLLAQLDVTFADKTAAEIVTDGTWKTIRGPVTFNHQYGGEDYDARQETTGWTEPAFDDRGWTAAADVEAPRSDGGPARLMLAPQPPVRICQTFPALKVTEPAPEIFVYDLGQNMSGWPLIRVSGPAGATIRLTPGELLDAKGLVTQRSSGSPMWYAYTLSERTEQEWHPKFSYYGFRYVQVTGAVPLAKATSQDNKPIVQYLAGQFVHADLAATGGFSCSSETLNRIHTMINSAILSNAQSVLTDCPHREKLGWLEQSHLMGQAIMMNWDVHGLYEKIENDIADAQHPDGLIPDIAPEYTPFQGGFVDSPEWGSAGIIAAWYAYLYYGDRSILANHYQTMKRYLDYLAAKSHAGIIGYGLGDWYDVGPRPPGPAQLTSTALTCTATYYQDLIILQNTAELLGQTEDARQYEATAQTVRTAFNTKFLHESTSQYELGSQTANAMPLAVGLVPDDRRAAVLQNLIHSVEENHHHVTAGDVGFSYVVKALTDAGACETLYGMATQADGPGYVDQLRKGATTLTEAWDALPSSSQNHLMLGHIEAWFYRGLGGIQADEPGFKHFFLRPEFPAELEWVRTWHQSPYGRIVSEWKRQGPKITVTCEVPNGSSATLSAFGTSETLGPGHYTRTFDIPASQPK